MTFAIALMVCSSHIYSDCAAAIAGFLLHLVLTLLLASLYRNCDRLRAGMSWLIPVLVIAGLIVWAWWEC